MLASATLAWDPSASGPVSGRMADILIGPDGMLEHWAPPPVPPEALLEPPLLEPPLLEHAASASTAAAAIAVSSGSRRQPRRRDSRMCCIRSLLASKPVPGTGQLRDDQ